MSETLTTLRDHFLEKATGNTGTADERVAFANIAITCDARLWERDQQEKYEAQAGQESDFGPVPSGPAPKKKKVKR